MKSKFLLTTLSTFALITLSANSAVIATLDFSDSIWTPLFSESNTAVNNSAVVGGTITADKTSGTGGAQVTVILTSSISTVGFENITIAFTGLSTGDLEWDASGGGTVNSTDGLFISGEGLSIDTNGIDGTAAETDFNSGAAFPNANFSSGFTLDPSVDNSAISSLSFTLRVNAAAEELSLSNVQIMGDAIVPEPSSTLLLGLGSFLVCIRRKR